MGPGSAGNGGRSVGRCRCAADCNCAADCGCPVVCCSSDTGLFLLLGRGLEQQILPVALAQGPARRATTAAQSTVTAEQGAQGQQTGPKAGKQARAAGKDRKPSYLAH